MTHITPAHAHMNIIQANNYSCSFFVVANLAKQLSNFKLKNIFYPWHLDNFRKWHIKAISPDVWRPEEQICRYSDIHSRKKNRKKTPSTTPFSITYEVAKCCCWISHFFEMPRPPLASSRHVACFDHVEKSFKFEDFLTLQERSGTSSAHPYGLRFGRIIGSWAVGRVNLPSWTTELPHFFEQKIHLQFLAYSMTSTGLLYLYLWKTCDLQLVIQLGTRCPTAGIPKVIRPQRS